LAVSSGNSLPALFDASGYTIFRCRALHWRHEAIRLGSARRRKHNGIWSTITTRPGMTATASKWIAGS
jgi:hypothetical protein